MALMMLELVADTLVVYVQNKRKQTRSTLNILLLLLCISSWEKSKIQRQQKDAGIYLSHEH